MPRIKLIVGLAVCATFPGCSPDSDQVPVAVSVFAAASLNDVLDELAEEFEKRHSVDVRVNAGASGALCTQIELGASCDIFLSADPLLVDRLDAADRVVSDSRCVLAQNRLVIAVEARAVGANGWPDRLASEGVSRIAVADPDSAPAGRYARQSLTKLDLWDRLQAKLVRAGDVRSALRLLTMRTVDAAIVYETDVAATGGVLAAFVFGADAHAPIDYVGAIMTTHDTRSVLQEAAVANFLEFLRSDAAHEVWRRYGFTITARRAETESS